MKKEFSPNSYTQSEIDAIVKKFTDNNQGVVVGRPYVADQTFGTKLNWQNVSAKWNDIKTVKSTYSLGSIRTKMIELLNKINGIVEDDVLGDLSVAFTAETEKGKQVNFLYTDMYMFLREAMKVRKATQEYKTKVAELEEARAYRDRHKSKDEIMAETLKKISELESELDEAPSTPAPAVVGTAQPAS